MDIDNTKSGGALLLMVAYPTTEKSFEHHLK